MLARVPTTILDRVYGIVSGHREKLGSLVPERPGPRRFP